MIVGEKVRLRAIEEEDLALLQKWRNDPETYRNFFEHEPLSMAMQKRWFERYLCSANERMWIIEPVGQGQPVGTIGYAAMDRRNRRCEVGRILIYPRESRGQGFAAEAQRLVCGYLFNHCNMNKLYCEIFVDNTESVQLYKRLGFKQEGLLRNHVFRNGLYEDVIVMALMYSEFQDLVRHDHQAS